MNNLKSFQACITIMAKEQKRGKGGGGGMHQPHGVINSLRSE